MSSLIQGQQFAIMASKHKVNPVSEGTSFLPQLTQTCALFVRMTCTMTQSKPHFHFYMDTVIPSKSKLGMQGGQTSSIGYKS